jgi:amino acid adenylation domain-containing protein/non-ribosomal peptide synthase protein (TIGR01720 family)
MHHIVSDGWSIGVLVQEIVALYEAFSAGQPSPLPELPLQYADFAHWQRNWLQGEVLEGQLTYWRQQLESSPPLLELPTDRPRPPVQTFRGAQQGFELPRGLTEAMKALSQENGTTPFMTLLAAFSALLYRYTGLEDINLGTPIANRNRAEIEGLIGFFVNTLVMRADLSGDPSFEELLKRVRETALGAYAHQDLPFEMLVDELQPERDMSHSPLFQVMFVLQNAPMQAQALSDLTLTPVEADSGMAQFDLTLSMMEDAEGMSGFFEYNTDLFDAATIERMAGHFQVLLDRAVVDPRRSLSELSLMTERERQQLLMGWNDTVAEYPRDHCVHELFEAQVDRTAGAVAAVFEDDQLTYDELNRRANQLAHHLQGLGVGPETVVGISVERSLEMIVGLLGILKAGGAYLPLDPTYPEERLSFMLEDSQVPVLLTQERLAERLPATEAEIVFLDADWVGVARQSDDNPSRAASPSNLAYVIYTSGSTGLPKGVMLQHRGLCNLVNAQTKAFHVAAENQVLQFASFSFDASVSETFMALLTGATLHLARQETLVSTSDLLELLRDREITTVTLPPSMLKVLPAEELPALETLISAGEACSPEIVARWSQGRRFINAYGPTEATIGPTLCVVEDMPEGATNVPIGQPIDNTQIYLLDANMQPVPVGVSGELYVGGVGVGRGYLNRPGLTAQKFIPDPFSDEAGARLYRTGDLARYRPDGLIEFLGRIDHQVKVRGFRIELGEIEAVLAQHPALQEIVVLAREDAPGVTRLVAYVAPEDKSGPSIGELRGFLKGRLPDYMVPSAFVNLDTLPLTPSGKVDRRALPAPEFDRSELESVYVAPRTLEEEILAGIWSELLSVDQVGVHDSFFNLGGNSLLATQLMSRIRDTFEIELPLRILFEAPTVSNLAARVKMAHREAQGLLAPPIEPVSRDEELPLSFAQQRLWFLEQLEPGTPFYNLPSAVRLTGPLNVAALEQSLNEIVWRHEALRTTFDTVSGRAVQVIAPEMIVDLPMVDLTDLPASEREDEVLHLAAEEARKPFDLGEGPLLRVRLLRLTEENHVVLLNMHHIVSDGWSVGVFVPEIAALYEAFSAGESSPLPELRIQYADFAHWQRRWLQGEPLEAQLDYWRERLSGSPPLLELPTDRPRPPVQTFRGRTYDFDLSPDLSEAVEGLSQREGTTLFMTLLAAFQTLLYRYTGQEDVNVGTPIANRTRAEIEGLIGFFVNTLVMRADFSGELSFLELLQQVRETALGAYAHQDVPFEMLVDQLQIERNLSHSPLFQVVFTLQNTPIQAQIISDLVLSPVEAETGIAKFDLTLSMMEGAEGLSASLEYNVDLFDAATIERMAGHFRRLLEGIVADPVRPIAELPLLTEAEWGQLLVEWNDTAFHYPQDKCVHDLFEAHAARTPHTVAVNLEGKTLTYRELDRRANQLAHYLQKRGVGPQTLVAICVERSLEMVVGLMGVLKAGGAYVPMDPTYPAERLAFMLEDTGAPVLLTQAHLMEHLRASEPASERVTEQMTRTVPSLSKGNTICLDTDWSLVAEEPEDKPESAVTPSDLAYVIYTSGSTGRPKGTLLEHRGLCSFATVYAQDFAIRPGSRVLQFFSFSFDGSVADIFSALVSGATLCLPRRETVVSMLDLHRMMQEQGVTHVLMTPSALAVLPADELPALQTVLSGGERCTEEVVARWSPGRRFINAYGPTEATVASSWYWMKEMPQGATSIPIGRPIANARLYVLDQYGREVPVGVSGELLIGGVGMARGYLNRPELTADRFVPDPFTDEPGARLYRTGDQVRYSPDGTLEFLGRIDHQVKVRGFRIELGEIEAVLVQHPALREVVILTREDTPGHKRLVAYMVSDQEPPPSVNELRDFLHEKLPDYMVPSAFVAMDALPLTPSGKVDRRALPAPEQARTRLEVAYIAPRTPEEETLADVWVRLLGLERVGIRDSFFELGGDSILIIQMIAQAGQAGLHITPKQVFQHPTIEGLAALAGTAEPSQTEQGIVTGPVPLTPIQHWFFEHHPLDPHHWNTSMLLEIGRDLDVKVLEQTVERLLTHHDALRLRFRKSESVWRQFNADVDEMVPFCYVDLSSAVGEQREAIESTAAELQASLNLSEGPLMRMAYLDLGPRRTNRLLIVFHHLVMDGVSWRTFIEDFLRVYQRLSRDESVQLPAKTTSFRRWSQELWRYAQSSELRQELEFWLQMGAEETPALPLDYPGGANTYGSTDSITMSLSSGETQALLQQVPAAYGTQINDVLLTALVKACARWTGSRKLLIEMEGHGREDILEGVDLSRTAGWFTTIFPVLLDLERVSGLEQELKAIQEQLRSIPNRGIGHGLLRYLCDDRRVREQLSALPQPEINFNYLGQFAPGPATGNNSKLDADPQDGWLYRFLAQSWRVFNRRAATGIRVANESVGPEHSPETSRSALLYAVGIVSGGELSVRWLYSREVHKRVTIERLAQSYMEELRSLIAHCLSPEAIHRPQTG